MTQTQIAEAFSHGHFELTYSFLSNQVQWHIIGNVLLDGKEAVINNCQQVAGYFQSVTTNFETIHVIAANNKVAINGTAEFIREGKRVSFVEACDVYDLMNKTC